MRKSNPVIAIACSDLHLSEKPPVARSCETDWFACIRRPLDEVRELANRHDCPVLFAGDLFDKWNPYPVVINFALETLPEMWAIPGNHDAPYHNLELIEQSAYWTVCRAGKISDINIPTIRTFENFDLWVFPFGIIPAPGNWPDRRRLRVALIHAYAYCGPEMAYPNAPPTGLISNFDLDGYDAAFFGDNHFPWSIHGQKPAIMNCGTMLRRKADEINYKPGCGLLYADGTITRYTFDCSLDRFIDGADKLAAAETATGLDLSGFAGELRKLAIGGLDFRDILIRYCGHNQIDDAVKKIILEAAGL